MFLPRRLEDAGQFLIWRGDAPLYRDGAVYNNLFALHPVIAEGTTTANVLTLFRGSHAIVEKQAQREKVETFLSELEKQDGLFTGFDESLWISLVDYATVFNKEDVRLTFKDGTEIRA